MVMTHIYFSTNNKQYRQFSGYPLLALAHRPPPSYLLTTPILSKLFFKVKAYVLHNLSRLFFFFAVKINKTTMTTAICNYKSTRVWTQDIWRTGELTWEHSKVYLELYLTSRVPERIQLVSSRSSTRSRNTTRSTRITFQDFSNR